MEELKIIAKKELEMFGGQPKVIRFFDENEKKKIDILISLNRPESGLQSCGTIGLSKTDINLKNDSKYLRIELLGVCDIQEEIFPNIISTVSFDIMDKGECNYGDIIENIIELYVKNSQMKHVFLTAPFLWENAKILHFEDKNVAWLLVVPISEKEREYADKNGIEALEDLFEEKSIDIYNIYRKSVV